MYRPDPTDSIQQQRKHSIRNAQIDSKPLDVLSTQRLQQQHSLPPLPTQPSIKIASNSRETRQRRWSTLKRSTAIITTLPQSASIDTPLWPDNPQQPQGRNNRLLTRSASQEIVEEDEGQSKPTPLLRDVIFQLRRYNDSWFKEVAIKHPEIFVDSGNYALYARAERGCYRRGRCLSQRPTDF